MSHVNLPPNPLEHIDELIRQCCQLKLEDTAIFEVYSREEIAQIYNGIGPEKFPEGLRRAITFLHPSFACASLIHDLEYDRGGTKVEFHACNWRLTRNAVKTVHSRYSFGNPLRYLLYFKALRFGFYCQMFGMTSWKLIKNAKESDFHL